MIHEDTEVLFPPRIIPALGELRDGEWQKLVDLVNTQPVSHHHRYAFVLMMVRLCGCITCHADSFRAMRGCTQCAVQTVRRFRGDDQELISCFSEAESEIRQNLSL